MIVKQITYTDFNGDESTESFYFHIKPEEALQISTLGGDLKTYLENMVRQRDADAMFDMYRKIILAAYGEKSPDGKRFVKSKELTEAFEQSNAFSVLFMDLLKDSVQAAEFINGCLESPNASNSQTQLPVIGTQSQ